jgi:hypothetical protein
VNKSFKGKLEGRKISSNGHEEVQKLPHAPEMGASYWLNSPNGRNEYTHQLFRFPAKFHPPVVRWALGNYAPRGSILLDPFTGSGTVQVEALLKGIDSVGIDIDPLACLVAEAKTNPLDPKRLQAAFDNLKLMLAPFVHCHLDREARSGADISEQRFQNEAGSLPIPAIPNITHWFRRYVIIDLARISDGIDRADLSKRERSFLRACFAATIRRVSNADPDPVSGLEVTTIQAARNVSRNIRVYDEFFNKTQQAVAGMKRLWEASAQRGERARAMVIRGTALDLRASTEKVPAAKDGFRLVITSPPYCRAVEYSRRHQLELYWLGFVDSAHEHVALTHSYIGRKLVRKSDWNEQVTFGINGLDACIERISEKDPVKARAVQHYFYSMRLVLAQFPGLVQKRGRAVCVIGDSKCCNVRIPTADFIAEIASDHMRLENRFSYALRNHYMQYGLWNGDGVKQEHVLVFKPR